MNGKNQHFVPRFYLKRFSIDESRASIRCFILSKRKFVESAPIKHQGASNNYYGEADYLNKTFENSLGIFLRRIDTGKITYSKKGLSKMLLLVSHLDLRNPIRIEGFQKLADNIGMDFREEIKRGMYDNLSELEQYYLREKLNNVLDNEVPKIKRDIVGKLLSGANKITSLMSDVQVKIIENRTQVPFITSDYPTVNYNQFFEINGLTNVSGYGNRGIQIFLPISSNLLVLIYDKSIYKVGETGINRITVKNEDDIMQLNLLQIYNCNNVIYGSMSFNNDYINKLISRVIPEKLRIPNVMSINTIGLNLSFIRFTQIAERYTKSGKFNQLRENTNSFADVLNITSTSPNLLPKQ